MEIFKLAIIGSPGSGKTTLAKRLSERLDLPVIHLDRFFLYGRWKTITEDIWREKVVTFSGKEKWIIDGDYFTTMEIRLAAADTIIFLNVPRYKCIYRLTKRMILACGRARSDMASECIEMPSWRFIKFLKFVWDYHKYRKPKILDLLKQYKNKRVYILNNSNEIDMFVKLTKGENNAIKPTNKSVS